MADKGEFEAYVLAWSGRADPDGNVFSFHACKQPLNYAGYCSAETDALLNQSRTLRDVGRAQEGVRADRRAGAQGAAGRSTCTTATGCGPTTPSSRACATIPDGLLRVPGLKLQRPYGAMFEFLLKRLAQIVPTLIFVSMLIFGLQQLLPGDPAMILAGEEQDPTVIAYLRAKLHLDEPLPVRYAYWIGGVLRGDLGESVRIAAAGARADRCRSCR